MTLYLTAGTVKETNLGAEFEIRFAGRSTNTIDLVTSGDYETQSTAMLGLIGQQLPAISRQSV